MTLTDILKIVGYGVPFILHSVGFVLLYKAKEELLPNQRLITMNLAVTETLYCMGQVLFHTLEVADLLPTVVNIILEFFLASCFCAIRFAVLHIIVDRFLDIWLNIKYPIYVNKKKILIAIGMQWIFGFCFGLIESLIWHFEDIDITLLKDVLLDVIVIVTAFVTNIYFFRTIMSMIQPTLSNTTDGRPDKRRVLLKLKIPCLMVLTFIIFNAASTILLYVAEKHDLPEQVFLAHDILDIFGWCSDALIYVLLQKRVRHKLVSICKGRFRNN